jgi:hypothetical protein
MPRIPRLLVLLGLALLGPSAAHGDADDALWRRLGQPDDAGHEEALARWDAATPQERLALVRAGLGSSDLAVARRAAAAADPEALDSGEIGRVMALCATDPAWVAKRHRRLFGETDSEGHAFGMPDIPAILGTAATTPGFAWEIVEGTSAAGHSFEHDPADDFHRALDVTHAAGMLALLETPNGPVAERIAGWLDLLASNTTRKDTRPLFAHARLYMDARARATAEGKPTPTLGEVDVPADGPGVPAAVRTLVLRALDVARTSGRPTYDPWLLRWLFDLAPVAVDLAFLREVVEQGGPNDDLAAWAIRGLAALDPEGTATGWRALAERRGAVAVEAAAEMARRGQPERLRALCEADDADAERAAILEWRADPDHARERWIERAASGRPSENVDLTPAAVARYTLELGVEIPRERLEALGAALVAGGDARSGAAWFFGHVVPEALTPDVAAVIVKRLEGLSSDRYADENPDAEGLEITLAALEVRAPKVLHALLARWAAGDDAEQRLDALRFLARLGATTHVEAMLATWGEWDFEGPLLGRVHDPRVIAFLRERAMDADVDVAAQACEALAVGLGLPDGLAQDLRPDTRDGETYATEPYAAARERLLAGDAEGVALALTREGHVDGLGSVRGERARERLLRAREARLVGDVGVHWGAVAELAVAGDPEARAAWSRFVRDGRVEMLDADLSAERVLGADPQSAEDWITHLDSNCCLGFHAWSKLLAAFPTAPLEKIGPVMTQNRVAFEPWWRRHRGSLVWSRLLDGWVPGP